MWALSPRHVSYRKKHHKFSAIVRVYMGFYTEVIFWLLLALLEFFCRIQVHVVYQK